MAEGGTQAAPGAAAPQRRHLTILFSDLTESTRIAASMETEDYAELLSHLRRFYSDVIPRHGGTVVQIQGDGVLAIFGYPEAHEDNARQATEAALDLHELVRGLRDAPAYGGIALSLHTGIHTGLVLFAAGDSVRGRFELLGNATNLASRLSDAAQADEILVSEEALGPEISLFVTSPPRPLMLKSRDEPLSTVCVLGRAEIANRYQARARRGLVPFVGRQAELALLHRHLESARGGQAAQVAISGAPGIGKTRLAEEFLQQAAGQGVQVLRGYCESYLSAEPLQPFMQVLRSLCGFDRGMVPGLAAQGLQSALAGADPSLLPPHDDLMSLLAMAVPGAGVQPGRPAPERTVAALRGLLAALAARRPLLLFVDDWQWSDDMSRQVLEALRGLASAPILALMSTRGFASGDAGMSGVEVLDLAPFSAQEAAATIARLLPWTSPFEVGELTAYAGGNPLILEELCHSAAQGRQHRPNGARDGVAWLNTLIESRIARLPPQQLEIARAAAVIGNVVPAWLLREITGCGESHPQVLGLAEQDVVFPAEVAGALRFKHGIARDVIYNSVSLRERKALHLRIAAIIESHGASSGLQEPHEPLALHYAAGGNAAQAARHAELAGDRALAVSALDRAQSQYRAALAALDQLPASGEGYRSWIQIAQRLAAACIFDPSREQLPVFRRAVELAAALDDMPAVATGHYWLGYIQYGLGDCGLAVAPLEQALACALETGDKGLAMRTKATLGQAHAAACDYGRALPLLEEAIASKRPRERGSYTAVGYGYTMACRGAVLGDLGRFAQAHESFDQAMAAVDGAHHQVEASILCLRSLVFLWQARWDEARSAAVQAQRVAERVKSLYQYARSVSQRAYIDWTLQRDESALQLLVDSASWLRARDQGLFMSLSYGWITEALAASGRIAEARAYAALTFRRARRQDRYGEAAACRALALASTRMKGPGAAHYLARAMASARLRQSPHEIALTQLCEAQLALGEGRRPEALALLEQAGEAFERMGIAPHAERARELARDS
jgi:class 3 adenylate cyclase/tetratricopeptide (TPR) repeat protein